MITTKALKSFLSKLYNKTRLCPFIHLLYLCLLVLGAEAGGARLDHVGELHDRGHGVLRSYRQLLLRREQMEMK